MVDKVDFEVLAALQREGRIAMAELAKRVGLSAPAVAERVRKLEEQGVILGYHTRLAPSTLGLGLLAFIGVTIEHPRYNQPFLETVARRPEILECHHVAGEDSYLLKVVCRDTSHLEDLITNEIKAGVGVGRTRTAIVLSTVKESVALPLDSPGKQGGE